MTTQPHNQRKSYLIVLASLSSDHMAIAFLSHKDLFQDDFAAVPATSSVVLCKASFKSVLTKCKPVNILHILMTGVKIWLERACVRVCE